MGKVKACLAIAGSLMAASGLLGAGVARAAPSGNTQGCAVVITLFEAGNPGITTAAGTPFGYGACGFGVPGGPP
jgi:hypothetical protein